MIRLRLNWELLLVEMRNKKITQRELAKKMNLDESRISFMMRNPEQIGLRAIENIAGALNINPKKLLVNDINIMRED